ncbi:MAG: hypothetical protein JJE17_10350 [Peptostreptococcaceae bacterium]|nr:hypothetical protein [Peptostreptococcaceae bacterium]
MATETIKGNTVTVAEVVKDAADRSKTETPPFFERMKGWAKMFAKVCGGVAIVGVGVISTFATAGVALPVWVTIGVGVLSGIGTLGAGVGIGAVKVASMTTTNKEILSRPSNEIVQK